MLYCKIASVEFFFFFFGLFSPRRRNERPVVEAKPHRMRKLMPHIQQRRRRWRVQEPAAMKKKPPRMEKVYQSLCLDFKPSILSTKLFVLH